MITVSLHGRGGQGIKTAAHIIGTAAFLSGYFVQDQPIYGAERRGAPISAYVRISKEAILERGPLEGPSLVVIGEDSLFDMPSDNPLPSASENSVILANSPIGRKDLSQKYQIKNPLVVFDLEKISGEVDARTSIGIAAASAACKILGLGFDLVKQSIARELVNIQVGKEEIARAEVLAKKVYDYIEPVNLSPGGKAVTESGIYEPEYHNPKVSTCSITATGNSMLRSRGKWSNYQPIIDYDKCTKCMLCYVYCPDSAYTIDNRGYPIVNYDACKGCNICETECPVKVITLVRRDKK